MAEPNKTTRTLAGIAGIVAIATLVSKVFGLVRQQAIAAAFGAGPAFGAYNFAYVIPGFLLILLGGINGPFHSAMVSVLAKRRKADIAPIVETITTLVVSILLVVMVLLIVFAEPLMRLVGPGLFITEAQAQARNISPDVFAITQQTRDIAIDQFRIMAPMAVLAGLIGIGFGVLNAADSYWLPSISPLLSSVTVLLGLAGLAIALGPDLTLPENAALGGAVLAWTTLAGAVLQWLVQLPVQARMGLGAFRPRFDFNSPAVKEVLGIMGPATFSSGMLQINVWTDLFFISFIPNAAAAASALAYAGLLVQTPLGILSNVILVPLMPVFSRLAAPEHWPELKGRIRQGLMTTAIAMLPISALMIVLALPIARVVYERFAFSPEDSQLTASVLVAYAIGMYVFLGRDVLVRVFYGLGDARTPFTISLVNIGLNALFDAVLVGPLGAPGIVLATVAVNAISMVTMLVVLHKRLQGLPLRQWGGQTVTLAVGAAIAGGIALVVLQTMERLLGNEGFFILLLQLCVAGVAGMAGFVLFASRLRLPEVEVLSDRLRQKFLKR
ncbi:MAG TPA: murein biosynthesis integral membrane protein MurJ [Synechococcales cyanobacterium M55_K2018_004]|nr:murein biosynthesis integral membrane protein MurJ [Synechococcales cyanobacterium M55_K2018_004]